MYADDTTLYCNIDSGHTSSTMINDELKKIIRWLAANKLSLNVRKTKYMVFHTARKLIERIQQFNFLGLHINNNFTLYTPKPYRFKNIKKYRYYE